MKTSQKEPRSIKDILLDIAEDPNDDYGKTLRRLPCIQSVGADDKMTKSNPRFSALRARFSWR